MFDAFGIRAPQMVATDLKARCTTADRVRTRLLEFCEREGADFVIGAVPADARGGRAGRPRPGSAPGPTACTGPPTSPTRSGPSTGLVRSCCMTLIKDGDHLLVDFTGTGPENPSPYNAHPQAAIGHFANYVYEYLFHDLPISNATFAPIDFMFRAGLVPVPRRRAPRRSSSVMVATGVMSACTTPSRRWCSPPSTDGMAAPRRATAATRS